MYSCTCLTCQLEGGGEVRESCYHGQTSRTLYTRQGEHMAELEREKHDYAMFKHKQNHHPNQQPEFQFQAERFFADMLTKQIFEGVSINNSPSSPGLLMHSKSEFQQGEVARVVMVRGLSH